ncbi:hypothetical protein LCGC14_1105530 [marine sediment metagenome]|uniref:Uncharacterized protein n=1 Tax=marine sediment metagenome TaxID=412755 RepID=A0A0F9MCY0_9ZZZZ
MIDTTKLIKEYLTASGSGLFTLVGTQVWCPMLPKDFKNTVAAIAFHPEHEEMHAKSAVQRTSFVFMCYGGSSNPANARAVYRALNDRLDLQHGTVTEGAIILATQTAMSHFIEPETEYPVSTATYDITTQ